MKRRRITARVTMRGAAGAEQRAPQAGAELRPEDRYLQLVINKISNGHISATGHPIRYVLIGSRYGFQGRRIEWCYFRLDHIQDAGRL